MDVGQIAGIGNPQIHDYLFKVQLISGNNKFRVIQRNYEGKIKKSVSVTLESEIPKLTFVYNKRTKEVVFSLPTQFEVHDVYGRLVKRGYGDVVSVSNLEKAEYYLSYDNTTDICNLK